MGVNGLWDVVKNAAQLRSLLNLATLDGFQRNNRKQRALAYRTFCNSAIAILAATRRHTARLQLAQWSRAPVILIFVFDGFGRPLVKRGKQVLAQPESLIQACKEAIKAFGYYSHQAPGEAEAELAQMNKLGFIDAVITEDSDTLVFGAVCIIRKLGPNIKTNAEILEGLR
ncbi:PIN domain-like protein [Favolaschia claudopus]|uniref:PIN domain-like protein n=1 Tax=Favolaschia claudopus TaxID=2862362 RepID=A0AAV9Z0X6_9AGAR